MIGQSSGSSLATILVMICLSTRQKELTSSILLFGFSFPRPVHSFPAEMNNVPYLFPETPLPLERECATIAIVKYLHPPVLLVCIPCPTACTNESMFYQVTRRLRLVIFRLRQ